MLFWKAKNESDNPNMKGFVYGSNSIRVQGSSAVKVLRGNCIRGHKETPMPVDDTLIPKRKRVAI
jgi:hypothetical protein